MLADSITSLLLLLQVYLSNCSTTVMAGQIQGPCEVLPPSKFNEERERISRLETKPNGGLQPLYLCKYVNNSALQISC